MNYASTDDGLRWWAVNKPDKRFIVFQGDVVTFAEADAWVDRVARYLANNGAKAGERIGVIGVNSLEWAIASLAILRVGGVHAPLSERSVINEVRGLTEKTGTHLVLVADSHMTMMREASALAPELKLLPLTQVCELRQGENLRFERPDIDIDSVAAIVYTSGSTGLPKGATFTMRSLLSIIQEWALVEPAMGHEARIVGVLPLTPMGGFINSILRPSVIGGTVFLMPKYDEREALRLLVEERCSSLMAPPLIFQRISALPEFQQADLSALSYAIIGGAPVPLDEFDKWVARGAALRQTYGSTEAGGHFSAMPIEGARQNPAGWGRGNVFRKVKALRPDGTPCKANEDGEIMVRGPGLMEGYWGDEEATAAAIKDGWLHTGDMGRYDENGIWKVTDRIKEVIITGGFNVGPTEVEKALLTLDGVVEAAVLKVADVTYGEAIGAIVNADRPLTAAEVVSHCRSHLANYKVPRYVLIVNELLPRSEQGKLSKVEMQKKYGASLAGSPRPQ
ncbi:MAG: AMP-dependent acyl-CoA synthetase [Hydrocarboniphaga sp.]|uniref:class I adenylate-forming enzyme family protein n=1 Tax=Hydrocarboniphaga sp. TaxID=2033016 RepID=UPI002634F554|nr:AMP-binding protein [Hydrocarboniphaga sp.]MDB5970073.1 AMP-dependent acyl-CoA synthetase [Hydrocarboniphaga sp.]